MNLRLSFFLFFSPFVWMIDSIPSTLYSFSTFLDSYEHYEAIFSPLCGGSDDYFTSGENLKKNYENDDWLTQQWAF